MTTKLQQEIIAELNVKPAINPAEEVERRVNFLVDYLKKSKTNGFVLGISGGQDSTLAGKLAQLAVEKIRKESPIETETPFFVAVRLPYAVQNDEDDAQLALNFINPDRRELVNIEAAVTGVQHSMWRQFPNGLKDYHRGNVKARIRAVVQYAIAGEENLLVIGTDHAAEAVTGFFTKFGDGAADILPLSGLTKGQGKELLKYLGAPQRLYEKVPTADLLDVIPGQADEAELGLSYETIDAYLRGEDINPADAEAIEHRWLITKHKRALPVSPQ